jgi:SAM-dependent methyltransferase
MDSIAHEKPQRCPICKSGSVYVFTSKHNRRIFKCSNIDCGHFFTPILQEDQGVCIRDENLAKESDESIGIFDERNIRLLGLFMSYLIDTPKPIAFLDFGAGNAHISRTFKRALKGDCVIYCLDPNPLCEGLYSKYELSQVKDIDELPEKVDFVYMIEVIEHLNDPISTLKVLRTILKSNGMMFFSTPVGRKREALTNAYDTPSHVQFFTPTSLNRALKASGFTEVRFRYYPEMYPLPLKGRMVRRVVSYAKSSLKRLLIKLSKGRNGIGHLVGLTRPV